MEYSIDIELTYTLIRFPCNILKKNNVYIDVNIKLK